MTAQLITGPAIFELLTEEFIDKQLRGTGSLQFWGLWRRCGGECHPVWVAFYCVGADFQLRLDSFQV